MKILFTANLSDCIEPVKYLDEESNVKTNGGYSKIKNIFYQNSDENTIVVDAGNFSGSNIYSTAFETKAPSLTVMKAMGYDAILVGKSEATRGKESVDKMLGALEENPNILKGNLKYNTEERNVNEYYILEKGSKKVGVFGVTSSNDLTEVFDDETSVAKAILDKIKAETVDTIICLYNGTAEEASQTLGGLSGINVVICSDAEEGTALKEGNTTIVGCSKYGESVGVIEISDSGAITNSIIKVDDSVEGDGETNAAISDAQKGVQAAFLNRYSLNYQSNFAKSSFGLDAPDMEKDNFAIADLITDSYRDAYVFRETDKVRNVVSITNGEAIKGGLYKGDISINDIYGLVSTEIGEDSLPGISLIRVYLSGKDLRGICELDASKLISDEKERLFFGGMKYDYNVNRPLWNMVEEVYISATKDYYVPIKDKTMYPVVMSTKMYEHLNKLIEETDGVSWTPIGIKGEENPELRTILLRNNEGSLIKEWSSIATYIRKGERTTRGQYIIEDRYSGPVNKKNLDDTLNPISLTKHIKMDYVIDIGKKIAYVIGGLILIKIFIAILNRFFPKKETTKN